MTIYHYALVEKQQSDHRVASLESIDMENVDYKRQPEIQVITEAISALGGFSCGIIRGGMFGLATNQVWVLSAWTSLDPVEKYLESVNSVEQYSIVEQGLLSATVRPSVVEPVEPAGIYVIRWIRMQSADIDEYTGLCLETWPNFEAGSQTRCYGVFREQQSRMDESGVSKLLMLTWYANLAEWENSRQLHPTDLEKWARRSEMELAHWAQAGRLG